MSERIEIGLNRKKLVLILLGSTLFVAAGLWFVINTSSVNKDPTYVKIVGMASILFFGCIFFFTIRKLLDKKPGLIIDNSGITDNASGVSAGYISWHDVEDIRVCQVRKEKFLMIIVRNPQDYLNRQSNGLKRRIMQQNHKYYGSPVSISANTLKIGFKELEDLLFTRLGEIRRKGKREVD